ncbi:MAG: hypothetical protein D6813_12270 [Calditrichaeota bacterium]|nr:MAG: hypothetical protein D6813_12270 [Calditrichota bacterium]
MNKEEIKKLNLNQFFFTLVWILGAVILITSCSSQKSWRDYQIEYAKLKAEKSGQKIGQYSVKEHLIEVPELGVRDRCTSCHVAMDDMQMFDQENPLKPHPMNYLRDHPVDQFGCTVCHGGNGETLQVQKAHSGNFRSGVLVQISCSKCHQQESLAGAPDVSHGKALMKKYQCVNCHYIRNFSETKLFRPAPRLVGIGSKVNDKWMRRWLKDPKSYLPNARMPKFQIEDKYIDALIGYLMTSKDPVVEALTSYPEGDVTSGKGTLRLAFCITCHPFNQKGGKEAPDLGRIGNKVREKWIVQMLQDPHRMQPQTTMPHYNFTLQQISDIAAYLMDEFTDWEMWEEDDTTKIPVYWNNEKERVEIGRKVYKELRCANCHGLLQETDGWIKIGPDLSFIGDKSVDEINFGNSTIPRTLPDYLFEKIKNPQAFATPENLLKMPKYDLSDEDIKDIVLALLSFNSDTIKVEKYRVKSVKKPLYEPPGEFGKLVEKFRCFSCHSFKGRGHNITYDLSLEGSRVQKEWLYNYLKLSYTIRPILTIRMPIFNMTDEEARILTEGIMHEMVSPKIPKNLESRLTPKLVEKGKQLFDSKGCLACHQVGQRGGYVGPSFTQGAMVGDKLQAGWIFTWLKNPQAIKPDVLEPNYGFTDEEALALTAYLKSITSKNKSNRSYEP